MKNNIRISVAMAVYNGEKYIKEQLDSILMQLNENDEIIVSDDGSTDNTIKIINKMSDNRIKIVSGPKQGVIANFENAIKNCHGRYIFLSDQDDVWHKDKVKRVLETFNETNAILVMHDAYIVDSNLNIINDSFYKFRKSKKGFIKNFIKNSFMGSSMAFKKELINNIIPIPKNIAMHDQWIGLMAEKKGKVVFISDKLLYYRRHDSNVSQFKKNSISKMISLRMKLLLNILKRGE